MTEAEIEQRFNKLVAEFDMDPTDPIPPTKIIPYPFKNEGWYIGFWDDGCDFIAVCDLELMIVCLKPTECCNWTPGREADNPTINGENK